MKATYREIKDIIKYTDWENGAFTSDDQPRTHRIGYYQPSGANWAYQVGIATGKDGNTYEVVTVFGQVNGYERVWL